MTGEKLPPPLTTYILAVIIIAAFVVRLSFSLVAGGVGRGTDEDAYLSIARNLAASWGYTDSSGQPTAYRSPLYPVLVAGVLKFSGGNLAVLAVLQAALGALIAVVAAGIADELAGRVAAILAGALVACDPFLIYFSGEIMTETVFTFFVAGAVYFLLRSLRRPSVGRTCLAALFVAAAGLTRPIGWGLLPLAALFALAQRASVGRRVASALAVLLVGALAAAPWVIRNFIIFNAFIPNTTHGGYTFVLGNNPSLYDAMRRGEPWLRGSPSFDAFEKENAEARQGKGEVAGDAEMWRRGKAFVREQPKAALWLALKKIEALWRPAPTGLSVRGIVPGFVRYALGAFSLVLYAAATVGIISLKGKPLPLVLFLYCPALFTMTHAVFWSQLRFRVPLHPLLAALAAAAVPFFLALVRRDVKPCVESRASS
ncbi:MAG: glycosyltransferase family 39 protein [Planctomycetota bacterium]